MLFEINDNNVLVVFLFFFFFFLEIGCFSKKMVYNEVLCDFTKGHQFHTYAGLLVAPSATFLPPFKQVHAP